MQRQVHYCENDFRTLRLLNFFFSLVSIEIQVVYKALMFISIYTPKGLLDKPERRNTMRITIYSLWRTVTAYIYIVYTPRALHYIRTLRFAHLSKPSFGKKKKKLNIINSLTLL